MALAKQKTYPENDYTIIETALTGSKRGRWFLDQYVLRNPSNDTGQMLSSINRLANLVEKQEEALQSILRPADMSLVKKALGIVVQYLSSGDKDTLVGLAHDLEQNATILSTASENLILAAASMKMGKVDDATFAQIVSEAERIQDAKRFTQSAKTKIATLFQALTLLEGHLRQLCDGIDTNLDTAPVEQATETRQEAPVIAAPVVASEVAPVEFEDTPVIEEVISQEEPASEILEIAPEETVHVDDIQASEIQEEVAETKVDEAEKTEESSNNKDDDDDDDDTPSRGIPDNIDTSGEEMSLEDIDALFASEMHDQAPEVISTALETSSQTGVRENAQAFEKKAGEMVDRVKNSLHAKIAEQQMKFFTNNQSIKLRVKPA